MSKLLEMARAIDDARHGNTPPHGITPGAWEVVGNLRQLVCSRMPDGRSLAIADTWSMRNACLIAAAPDMLAALKDAAQTFEAIGKVAPRSIEAAIAKATEA